jgi:hypothetical protein
VIRLTEEARRLLSSLWTPDGEVLRLIRDFESGPGSEVYAEELAFRILLAAAEFFSWQCSGGRVHHSAHFL